MLTSLGVSFVLAAAFAWTAVVAIHSRFESVPSLLIGLGMILTATVAVVGILVTSGRWSRRLALAGLAMGPATAWSAPVNALWLVAMAVTAIAAIAVFQPALSIRKLPSATGPPTRAVLTPLVLLMAPFAYGLAGNGSSAWALLAVGISAPITAFMYARVIPGGLVATRYAWPALAVGFAVVLDLPAALTSVGLAAAVAILSWSSEAKTAFHPPREMGSSYPIPPELSPREVLDAANINEKGRPR